MIIEVTKVKGDLYLADATDLPGAPPLGVSRTIGQAVANLFAAIFAECNETYTKIITECKSYRVMVSE